MTVKERKRRENEALEIQIQQIIASNFIYNKKYWK